MAPNLISLSFLLISLPLSICTDNPSSSSSSSSFIVIVDPESKPHPFPSHFNWYFSLISSSSTSPSLSQSIHCVYHNDKLIHGFSATLTQTLSRQIQNSPGILTVLPDYLLHPHTTRSPFFLHLDPPRSLLSNLSHFGSNVIIGVIDTGIWPESPSFNDHNLDPVPPKWKGECQIGHGFNKSHCNRKLIGARYFNAGYSAAFADENVDFLSPRDSDGHGTHVASIAAGSPVTGANFKGLAYGIARGMAPKARIAVYKVCWNSGCLVSDIISAIDRAVSDGVHVISLSLGSSSPAPFYYLDPLAIATFRAALNGVFVAASAGNGGPHFGSVANSPPWITTVGASTIDREFPVVIRLGNGKRLIGMSISVPIGLTIRGKITADIRATNLTSSIVFLVADRQVSRIGAVAALEQLGATGVIIFHGDIDPNGLIAEPHVIPTVTVRLSEAFSIQQYINGTRTPTAVIFSKGTKLLPRGTAPVVASFSSRGPNPAVPWFLKPDLVGPGINILGAWTGAIAPSGSSLDNQRSGFNIMSGTSMACPHVSGVAALIRAAKPEWTPSEIRSAMMTTAVKSRITDETGGRNADPFGLGAGLINPNRAVDPGLVYDIQYEDYVAFMCGLNYGKEEIRVISGRGGAQCGRFDDGIRGFNYPGFVIKEEELGGKVEVVLRRRLKWVGGSEKGSWYEGKVVGVNGIRVEVKPKRLWFSGRIGERLEFRLVLRTIVNDDDDGSRRVGKMKIGLLRWVEEEGRHVVESPIVVFPMELIN